MVAKICRCFEFLAVTRLVCSFAPSFRNNQKSCIIFSFIFVTIMFYNYKYNTFDSYF